MGIERSDTDKDAEYIARKILNLRLFDGENGKSWDKSVSHMNYEVLLGELFQIKSNLI